MPWTFPEGSTTDRNNCLSFASYLADLLLQALWLTSCRCSDFCIELCLNIYQFIIIGNWPSSKANTRKFCKLRPLRASVVSGLESKAVMHGQISISWVVKTCWVSCLACFALGPKIGRPPWGRLSAKNKSGMLHQWYGAVYVENHAPGLCICDIITFL